MAPEPYIVLSVALNSADAYNADREEPPLPGRSIPHNRMSDQGRMVNWANYSKGLAVQEQTSLINCLTVGAGSLALAARLARDNADASDVLLQLGRAYAALCLVEQLTACGDGVARPTLHSRVPTHRPGAPLSWDDLLAELEDSERVHVHDTLADAVGDARQAGTIILSNGAIDDLHVHLAAAIAALQRLDVLRLVLATC